MRARTRADLRIPTPLRAYTDRQSTVGLSGATVGEAMTDLVEQYPNLRQHLYGEDGALRSYVNLYLNGEDIRHLEGVGTPLSPGDKLALIPAVAGGW
jgi:molybdopterin converting factor small subunit